MFKEYKSKPITRLAHEITEDDIVGHGNAPNLYLLSPADSNETFKFVAYDEVKVGDFVVYLNEDDIYHCSRKVMAERNEGIEE